MLHGIEYFIGFTLIYWTYNVICHTTIQRGYKHVFKTTNNMKQLGNHSHESRGLDVGVSHPLQHKNEYPRIFTTSPLTFSIGELTVAPPSEEN